jgi:hypothetical protein
MWMQIVAVSIFAAVFLVRLTFALHDRPTRPRGTDELA